MSDKKNFILRIDTETYKALEKWAADEFRSVNGQVEWILSQRLREEKRLQDPASKAKRDDKGKAKNLKEKN